MPAPRPGLGRAYFAAQALAGALWWVAVFTSPAVRTLTLGGLDPVLVAILDIPLFVIASGLAAVGVRAFAWVAAPWTILVAAGMALYATMTGEAGWGALLMVAAAAGSTFAAFLVLAGGIPAALILFGPFRFRSAATSTARGHLGRTGAQIVVFWGVFLVVLPTLIVLIEHRWQLHFGPPPAVRVSGAVLLLAASALGIWSAVTMSTRGEGSPLPSAMPARLVIAGPYRFVRNPMAVAGIAQGVAIGLIASSWLVVAYALIGSLVWNWVVRPLEEADLLERFGEEFERYRSRVPCWVPRRETL